MMRGIASSRGAITILNAIPTGTGSALGISLQTDAEVVLEKGEGVISASIPERNEDTRLAEECVRSVCEKFNKDPHDATVRTFSSIPISRGLKSSSAAANAMTLATIRALGEKLDDVETVRLGVEAAKRAGVTVTGAFDDAMACYFGGVAVTENQPMKILRQTKLTQKNLRVILHVPQQKIRKKGLSKDTFKGLLDDFKEAERLVLTGRYFEALTLNGSLVAKTLGIDETAAKTALENGALAAGVTGTGPATAIICEEGEFNILIDRIPHENAVLISAHLNEKPAPEVGPRF